jgi:hypothetical protein
MIRKAKAPSIRNDHYDANPVAFDAVALMQHRLQSMGAAPLSAGGGVVQSSRHRNHRAGRRAVVGAGQRDEAGARGAVRGGQPRGDSRRAASQERPWQQHTAQQRRRPNDGRRIGGVAAADRAASSGGGPVIGNPLSRARSAQPEEEGQDRDHHLGRPPRRPDDDDVQPPITLSLAQRLGLVDMPDMPLTSEQWGEVAADASRKREDDLFSEPCAICVAPFRDEKQVILSCGHVFHRECLLSWEAFSQTQNGSRSCPCCRHRDYQKRTFTEGSRMYRTRPGLARTAWYRESVDGHQPRQTYEPGRPFLSLPALSWWVASRWCCCSDSAVGTAESPPRPPQSHWLTRGNTHSLGSLVCNRQVILRAEAAQADVSAHDPAGGP